MARVFRKSSLPAGHPERNSHFESAQEANDIYNLYGRDSWVDESQVGVAVSPSTDRGAFHQRSGSGVEELDDEMSQTEEEVFRTPMSFLDAGDYMHATHQSHPEPSNSRPIDFTAGDGNDYSQPYESQVNGDHAYQHVGLAYDGTEEFERPHAYPYQDAEVDFSTSQDQSFASQDHDDSDLPLPEIVPPIRDQSPALPESWEGAMKPGTPSNDTTPASALPPRFRASQSSPVRDNSLSPGGSANSSPVHPAVARLHNASRNVSGASSSGMSSVPSSRGLGSNAASDASLVSSQYPGEEQDAFHVRSTYARLEVEGVYGDGWDEGIERTRGGMSARAERVTMIFPSQEGGLVEQERKFLSSLDRYGFIAGPAQSRAEGRLALIPAAPLGKVPKLRVRVSTASTASSKSPKAVNPNAQPPSAPQVPANTPTPGDTTRARRKEEERVAKWMRMMSVAARDGGGNVSAWRWSSKEGRAKYQTRTYKGIPDRWRMAAWWTLAEGRAAAVPRTRTHEALEADYQSRKDQPSTNDVQIDLDVPRTISGHALFKTRFGHGQRALFHVLHAFSQSCGTCGYCQGMGSVAATLLCYFEPERAYTLMVRLHDQYNMHGIFAPGFPGLLESFYVQERLLEALMPEVYENFQRNLISSSAWAAKIYITLFVNTVPFHTQLRIWDALFLDGYDVMVVAVVAMIWSFRNQLGHPAANFESILSLLSSFYVVEDEDALLDWMRKFLWAPGVREKIALWRREWKSMESRNQTDGVLL